MKPIHVFIILCLLLSTYSSSGVETSIVSGDLIYSHYPPKFEDISASNLRTSFTSDLSYFGGPVLSGDVTIYNIYQGRFSESTLQLLEYFVNHLPSSTWFNILSTYRIASSLEVFSPRIYIPITPENSIITSDITVFRLIASLISNGDLPLDENAIYVFYFTGVVYNGFCSFWCSKHGAFTAVRVNYPYYDSEAFILKYIIIGDPVTCPRNSCGNASPGAPSPNANSQADVLADTLSQQIANSITNPEGTGWYDASTFEECTDKCTGDYGTSISSSSNANVMVGAKMYRIQSNWEYNPPNSACTMGTPGAQNTMLSIKPSKSKTLPPSFYNKETLGGNCRNPCTAQVTGATIAGTGFYCLNQTSCLPCLASYYCPDGKYAYRCKWNTRPGQATCAAPTPAPAPSRKSSSAFPSSRGPTSIPVKLNSFTKRHEEPALVNAYIIVTVIVLALVLCLMVFYCYRKIKRIQFAFHRVVPMEMYDEQMVHGAVTIPPNAVRVVSEIPVVDSRSQADANLIDEWRLGSSFPVAIAVVANNSELNQLPVAASQFIGTSSVPSSSQARNSYITTAYAAPN